METYTIPPAPGATPTDADVQEAISVLTARLAALGIEGGTVSGDVTGLRVSVPETSAGDDLATALAATGLVEFVPLPPASYGTMEAPGPFIAAEGEPLPVPAPALFSNDQITSANPTMDEYAGRAVRLSLTAEGTRLFADYTSQHVGEFLAIVRDGTVVTVPVIMSPMTDGQGIITGGGASGFSPAVVTDLVMVLRSGALPAAFRSGEP